MRLPLHKAKKVRRAALRKTDAATPTQSPSSSIDATENAYLRKVMRLRKTIPTWDYFFQESRDAERDEGWSRLEVLGQPLTEKYAWAIPDKHALKIIAHFSPIVEMAAGRGYWAHLLQSQGVDVLPLDAHANSMQGLWTPVQTGSPKSLSTLAGRTLLLCYPDEASNVAFKCLRYYHGDYIIHIGELITTGTISGQPQAPFGRTTSSDFQIHLFEAFHCVLVHELPSFPFCKDYLTVWKRTHYVPGRDKESGEWADIPPEERLPMQAAAPFLSQLLLPDKSDKSDKSD